MKVVLDTNVIVAAMRSPRGASAMLVNEALAGRLEIFASPALFLEYEAVLTRPHHLAAAGLTRRDIDISLEMLAKTVVPIYPYFTYRPLLPDPDDEMVLEVAINARADVLVTFEGRTFEQAAPRFGLTVMTPAEIYRTLRR
ncbi:MAG TPA: putative toxin-antitoxin system toxin component, PIN family [Caulobacterales bacterium]|nr:putative toxin-antitoxin system toxin component, PIN family [Caulobacterales bacterium]